MLSYLSMEKSRSHNIGRKLLVGLSIALVGFSITGCGNKKQKTIMCNLVKEVARYDDFELSATEIEGDENHQTLTIKNTGDKCASVYDFDYSGEKIIKYSSFWTNDCPFSYAQLLNPGETATFKTDFDKSEVAYINNHPKDCYVSSYYTTEYNKIEFKDFKVVMLTDEEKHNKGLIADVLVYYTVAKGKFIDGDNYHLKINFTYKGKSFSVMSSDPLYEEHAFGLDLNILYRYEDLYPEKYFNPSKMHIESVQCYTAWKRSKQPLICREFWRAYESKESKIIPYLMGFGIPLLAAGGTAIYVFFFRKKRKIKKY